ncbi:hypothetical protein P170DRAFT_167961, partial [Aspergillus steynii IBT 23096]
MTIHQGSTENYSKIGSGFCGTVWAIGLDGPAIKREDGGPSRSLANDFTMHQRAIDAFRKLSSTKSCRDRPSVRIPQCHRFISSDDTAWWTKNLPFFPHRYSSCNAISSERIPPFPDDTRALLVGKYCHFFPELRPQIMTSTSNQACLIRPYIGRQRTYGTAMNVRSRFRGFSLQNFPLHIDQMAELGIPSDDIECYAAMMGEALAALHWLAEIDANDVEFVLAPLPVTEKCHNNITPTAMTNVLGKHTMWTLDFDLCRPLTMDFEGVRNAVNAFFKNDPFTPRPKTNYWTAFCSQYLRTAKNVICSFHGDEVNVEDRLALSTHFIESVEQRK